MVAGTQPPEQHPLPSSSTATAEDEALKRNTDCVYFLASPLTCKKGSECEYRHSEYARVNPRDCWYWLNGNCLNPKCSFRHPPLDGLLGTQVTSAGSSLPSSQTATITATQASHISGKQAVSCIFFQKGLCMKGDRCAFLHGPHPTSNKAPQVPAATPKAEPPTLKKPFGGLEKCTQEYKAPQVYKPKSVEVPVAKPASKTETVPLRNGVVSEKHVPEPTRFDIEHLRYKSSNVASANNGNGANRSNRSHQIHASEDQSLQNSKDAEEFLRESSPGFDVLVDDELGDAEYYHSEDQFRGARVQEGRNLNAVNEYDIGRSADYSPMVDVDQEMYRDPHGYDSHDPVQGQYAWEQHRASSERISGPTHLERRGYPKAESRDHFNESDLRHHLSKHRRVNGLRSVVSRDYANDNHEERGYRGSSRTSHYLPPRESSRSSRLTGRIKLPGRSSPVNDSDMRKEREMERGRNWGRSSPGRPQISSQHGRLRDRIKGKVEEDYKIEEQTLRGPRLSREVMDASSTDFAPPKSLSELKGVRNRENREQQSLGKRKNMKIEDHQQGEDVLAFEGPKPLSEILKRKKGAGVASSVVRTSLSGEENNQRDRTESLKTTAVTENESGLFVALEADGNSHVHSNKEELNSATADAVEAVDGHSSQLPNNASELEFEDGMIVDEGMEDHEYEADDDHKEGDYDYEQVDEGDYNFDEGENVYPEEEYLEEDEDGDDFAKKIGVVL